MELQQIVDRYAEALTAIDASTTTVVANPRTGEIYPASLKALGETRTVTEIDAWWAATYPDDFSPPPNRHQIGFKYPNIPRAACDHVFTTDAEPGDPEWAIEVKNIAFIGNNGKRNDFAVAKVLSPYLKDRSLLHDVVRLREHQIARRHAVIGYTFRYDLQTCATARALHPHAAGAIAEIEQVCLQNGGEMSVNPLVNFCEGVLLVRNLVVGTTCRRSFEAWRHPCAGEGLVFGWEISPPSGPQHPW